MESNQTPYAVVFDLGGVLLNISHTWQDAAQTAGVTCRNLPAEPTPLATLKLLELYQTGQLPAEEYLPALADFAGCDLEDAKDLHNGILVDEYPGALELVEELQARGVQTGCLSNTSALHWELLAGTGPYPGIQKLEWKMASHLAGLHKPDPKIYELYCATYGREPGSLIFFDDFPQNVNAALACGWQAFWIDSTKDTSTQLREHLGRLGVI